MKANNPNQRTFAEMEERRTVARYLYIEQNLSANTIAAETGLSQTTVSRWVKKRGWDKARKEFQQLNKRSVYTYLTRPVDTVTALQFYLKTEHPALAASLNNAVNQYAKLVDL